MSSYPNSMKTFFNASRFAVVGASNDRSKWSNKVFRWYLDRDLPVVPVNPADPHIEGISATNDATKLPDLASTSISIIVNSKVGYPLLQKLFDPASKSNWPHAVWLQPGAEDEHITNFVKEKGLEDRITLGGPCILVLGDGVRHEVEREQKDDGSRL